MIIDCHNHIGTELLFYLHGDYPYGQDIPALLERRASSRITHWIIFPFVTNLSCKISALIDGEVEYPEPLEHIPYAYENRRLLTEVYHYFPEHSKQFLPFAIVDPSRSVQEQVAELRKLKEHYPFYGLKIQPTIIQSPITALNDAGKAFVDLAREWDIPFLIHSSVGDDPWSQVEDILDIAEANPDVRFCLAHNCRFDKPGLDRMASLPNTWFDCSAHIIHCESVTRRLPNVASGDRLFKSDYTNPSQVLHDLYQAYPDRLMWGSDSPFYSWVSLEGTIPFALKSSYDREVDCLYDLPEEAIQKIAGANILNFLNHGDESILS